VPTLRRDRYPDRMNATQKLRQLCDDINSADGLRIVDAWSTVARLLPRCTAEQDEAARVIRDQDAAGLAALIDRLENPAPKDAPRAEASHEEMKHALHAFRKRLKLARLNDESKLGGRYTSGGKHSKIDAVPPPDGYPQRVWDALVQAGTLIDTGNGFYADADDQKG
jgi:hypothetical protein